MKTRQTFHLIQILVAVIAIILFWYSSRTITSVIIFIPGVIISYIFCLGYLKNRTTTADKLLPWYLFAMAIQLIHFLEEYKTGFIEKLPALVDQVPYPLDDWIALNMIAYAVFVLGGIVLHRRIHALLIIPVFFILIGVVFNGIAHVLLSLYVGGYFPGLITALIYIVLGPYLVRLMFKEGSKA